MSRSTCLLTLPRCGSEILQHHLECSRNLQWAGEFLTIYGRQTATHIGASGTFIKDWTLNNADNNEGMNKFFSNEFNKRINILEDHRIQYKPLIVKSFVNTYMYGWASLERVCDLFDIVILSRRDKWRSILSLFICKETSIWHETDVSKIQDAKNVINSTKITVDEQEFFKQIQTHNFLTVLQNNIHKFQKDAVSVYYEDYAANPIADLDRIFNNSNPVTTIAVNRLIDDHESHFENITRLKELYNKYIIE